ncbi:Glutathione synthetase [Mycoemilia scoparia]|uniref:Glutathione synthetase n=1 Tax=Mycoemilia scoparia TaxID=417184 RepID=A0A9W8DRT7_9FUNG|nr:Glutathione synthetase [Mycoemilia scoparia]
MTRYTLIKETGYNNEVDQQTIESIKKDAQEFAYINGLVLKSKTPESSGSESATPAPVALLPTPFPRYTFEEAYRIHDALANLYHVLSQDREFIDRVIEPLTHGDEFTKRLYDIYLATRDDPLTHKASLEISRSDYMVDKVKDPSGNSHAHLFKQVEFNTVAVSFSSLSAVTRNLHEFITGKPYYKKFLSSDHETNLQDLPDNQSLAGLSQALYSAHKEFDLDGASILVVVQPGERNKYDQLHLQHHLYRTYGVHTIRKTLAEINKEAKVGEKHDKRLLYIDETLISTVYFRSGYAPTDYPTEDEWSARLLLEKTYTIKGPTVAYQLVGCKKAQQVLTIPGELEKYEKSTDKIPGLRKTFAGIYPLDQSELGLKAYELALSQPTKFVLKPQREGGGYNVYKENIPAFLKNLTKEERGAYILMELIQPPVFGNWLMKEGGEIIYADVVSELGIYGAYVCNKSGELSGSPVGHLLRSKPSNIDEGGVASGFGVIDSPALISDEFSHDI